MSSTLTPRRRIARMLAPVAVIALVASGCGVFGNEAEAAERVSPLEPYLSAMWGTDLSQEEQQRRFDDQAARREELIAQCMAEKGFTYIPNLANQGTVVFGGDEVDWRPDERDWVEQWGYGAVHNPWRHQREEAVDGGDDAGAWHDPNWEAVEQLPQEEQDAFWAALWGPPRSEDDMEVDAEGNPIWDWDWTQAGCHGWAQHSVQMEDGDPWANPEFAPLMEALEAFWAEQQHSEEMAALNREWSQCMSDAGHPGFTVQWDAQSAIFEEMNEIFNSFDWETGDDPYLDPDMVALGEREIAMALTDLDCRESINFREREETARFAAEERFVAENHAALRAARDAAEQGR